MSVHSGKIQSVNFINMGVRIKDIVMSKPSRMFIPNIFQPN